MKEQDPGTGEDVEVPTNPIDPANGIYGAGTMSATQLEALMRRHGVVSKYGDAHSGPPEALRILLSELYESMPKNRFGEPIGTRPGEPTVDSPEAKHFDLKNDEVTIKRFERWVYNIAKQQPHPVTFRPKVWEVDLGDGMVRRWIRARSKIRRTPKS